MAEENTPKESSAPEKPKTKLTKILWVLLVISIALTCVAIYIESTGLMIFASAVFNVALFLIVGRAIYNHFKPPPGAYNPKTSKTARPLSIWEKIFLFPFIPLFLFASMWPWAGVFHLRADSDARPFVTVFFPAFFIVCTFISIYRLFVSPDKQKKLSNTFDLTIAVGILFLLVGIASPGFNQYKPRAYNSDAKSNLHNLYLGCKAYWMDKGDDQECNVAKVTTQEYGYVQSNRMNIEGHGSRTTFVATAQHMDSTTQYTMDAEGNIK